MLRSSPSARAEWKALLGWACCALPWVALLTAVGDIRAVAQDSSTETARQLFEDAAVAADAGRLAEAESLLERSLALAPRASTAFNLAAVHHEAGEDEQAERMIGEIRRGDYGDVPDAVTERLDGLQSVVRSGLGRLQLEVDGAFDATLTVLVDGERWGEVVGASRELYLAPGRRTVEVSAGEQQQRRTVRILKGRSTTAEVIFEVLSVRAPRAEESESSWGVWLAVGLGTAVVAGLIVGAVFLFAPSQEEDPVWGSAEALGGGL
ncbi:MAG: tetratricopeptide repeat protein [Myxococcota bacterium]